MLLLQILIINFAYQCVMFMFEKVTLFIELIFRISLSLTQTSTNCLFYQFGDGIDWDVLSFLGPEVIICGLVCYWWRHHFCLKMTISDLEITYSLNFVLGMNFSNYLIVLEYVAWPLDKSATGWFLDRPVGQNWFKVLAPYKLWKIEIIRKAGK